MHFENEVNNHNNRTYQNKERSNSALFNNGHDTRDCSQIDDEGAAVHTSRHCATEGSILTSKRDNKNDYYTTDLENKEGAKDCADYGATTGTIRAGGASEHKRHGNITVQTITEYDGIYSDATISTANKTRNQKMDRGSDEAKKSNNGVLHKSRHFPHTKPTPHKTAESSKVSSSSSSSRMNCSREFKSSLAEIVNDLTCKVITSQPTNILAFCADYLEQKLKARCIEQEEKGMHITLIMLLMNNSVVQ